MSQHSKIEWTDATWNFLVGCDKVSDGCKNCYAIRTAWKMMHNPNAKIAAKFAGTAKKTEGGALNWTGKVGIFEEVLQVPLKQKKPTRYFVNSLSDLFHEGVPFEVIAKAFTVMALCPQHTFQILTKRPQRMLEYFKRYENGLSDRTKEFWDFMHLIPWDAAGGGWPQHLKASGWSWDITYSEFGKDCNVLLENQGPLDNIWLGVSVENQEQADKRIPLLLQCPAAVRFLSCEPLLGPVVLPFDWLTLGMDKCPECGSTEATAVGSGEEYEGMECMQCDSFTEKTGGIDWIIVGGESGKAGRPMHPAWVRSLRDQCQVASVAFFFKQWGEYLPFEATAQPPFYARADNGEEYDGHELNFIHPETGETGTYQGHAWYDMDATMVLNLENDDLRDCSFLRVGKFRLGRQLDGREWNDMPAIKSEKSSQ
jgi:protein gp37